MMRNLDPATIVKFRHRDTYKDRQERPDHLTMDDIEGAIADAETATDANLPKAPGLYLILNRENRRIYVGRSSKCIRQRAAVHFYLLRKGQAFNAEWLNDFHRFGAQAFGVAPLTLVDPAWGFLAERRALELIAPMDTYNLVSSGAKREKASRLTKPNPR